jgi:hypothetical protein
LDVAGAYTQRSASFGVPGFESRFDELRKTVTPTSVFGYTSDNPRDDPSDQAEFYLTQYTLAPAIVTSSTLEKSVIVNLHSAQPGPKDFESRRLTVVQNFGNDVFLARPVPAQ